MSSDKWVETARAFLPGVPAVDRLAPGGELSAGDNGISAGVATALAAAGYRLKYGHSVTLLAPFTKPQYLKHVITYLHTCRMNALAGLIRATWFSSRNMTCSPDLLVWTRALSQKKYLKEDPSLQIRHIGLNRDLKKLEEDLSDSDRILRTIVCQQSGTIELFCEELRRQISPFAIIIDITPFGYRENPRALIGVMREQFPDTPILLLAAIGDASMGYKCVEFTHVFGMPIWQSGLSDSSIWTKKKITNWKGAIALLPDNRLDERLVDAGYKVRSLHRLLAERYYDEASFPLFRVYNTLLTLCMPIEFYEMQADISRRGGPFPLKPLKDWLTKAQKAKLPTGESQACLDSACQVLEELLAYVVKGKTGKQQALTKWIHDLFSEKKRGRIIVRGEREAALLRKWLLIDNARQIDDGRLDVIGVGSAREIYRFSGNWDKIIIVGKLTPLDTWSAGLGKHVTWLSYPCELPWIQKLSQSAMLVSNSSDDNKVEWWMLTDLSNSYSVSDGKVMDADAWTGCTGQYIEHKHISLDLPENADWMMDLFRDLDWEERQNNNTVTGLGMGGNICVRTDEGVYYWDVDLRLDVLTDKYGVVRTSAREIQIGDELVMLHGEDRGQLSLLELFFEHIPEETNKIDFYRTSSSRWLDFLDVAISRHNGLDGLHKKMADTGVAFQTLHSWVKRKHVVQKNRQTMVARLAELSGIEYERKDLDVIINSLKKLQGKYIQAGKTLKVALTARAEGVDEIEAFGRPLSVEMLDDMLNIETVLAVSVNEEDDKQSEPTSLYDQVLDLINGSEGKLTITSQGKSSIKETMYRDTNRVITCLKIMRDNLYEVYANGKSLQGVINDLKAKGIDFKGGMSEITQGKFKEYQRTYEGRRVDIGKHLGIGDSRSPERCFRLHFHWDDDAQTLVIHHAGKHLRTSTG